MSKKDKNKKGRKVAVNMTGVESGSKIIPEADYTVKPVSVTQETSDDSGKEYLKWEFEITEGEYKGTKLWHNTSLQPQALFNLKGVLISLGYPVPDSKMDLDLDELENGDYTCGVSVFTDTYDGKKKSKIGDFFPLDGSGDDDDDDPDFAEMDLEDLLAFAKENELDISDLSKKDKKKVDKVRAAVEKAWEESGGGDDDDPNDDGDDDGPDLEAMSLEELLEFAKEKEIDLSELNKKDKKKATKVREVIQAALDEEDDEPDVDNMGLQEMLDYAKENEIDLGLNSKQKKKESAVRTALKKALEEENV